MSPTGSDCLCRSGKIIKQHGSTPICLKGVRRTAHCLVGDAGIPSELVGCVYRKLLVSVLPISQTSENRLADADLCDAPVYWATEENSCLDETGR